MIPKQPLLRIHDLHTDITVRSGVVHALAGVNLTVEAGQTLGIVGESGSGKTMTALSVMGLLPQGGAVTSGAILLGGQDLTALPRVDVRRLRGTRIGMIFQDPLTSLNPTMRIGVQVAESLRIHEGMAPAAARARTVEILERVGMPRPEAVADSYPHQLSGGMRQRVMIAMALVCRPDLLIADEPTTALDVTTQMQILDLIDDLRDEYGMGVILITHDLGVVAGHTDRVAVMYGGRIMEDAPTAELFSFPRHRYTTSLLQALPERALATGAPLFSIPGSPPNLTAPPAGCRFAPRCLWASAQCHRQSPPMVSEDAHSHACLHPMTPGEVLADPRGDDSPSDVRAGELAPVPGEGGPADPPRTPHEGEGEVTADLVLDLAEVSKQYDASTGSFLRRRRARVSAVDRVSLKVGRGQTYGLVGESGCGKSTLGRLIAGLERADGGSIHVLDTDLVSARRSELRAVHRDVQMMFQDSYAAMDPRMRIDEILAEPMLIQRSVPRSEIPERVALLLEQVGLDEDALARYPHEFSGGQLQRIGFARSLALEPDLVVADEPVSALDVSVQAQVLNLMKRLQAELGLSYVFISHDLAVVQYMADKIGVMYLGRIVEEGPAREVVSSPKHPYTRALIESIPVPDPTHEPPPESARLSGEPPSAIDPPEGCRFRPRCPFATDACLTQPMLVGDEHTVACHHPLEPVAAPVEVAS
ncbi:ABC transporter ATP-binding protein [Schaalia sp. 19OD2882]|uniref:dipeptide ABC transporter ATP-binding protein n=1 Tax=Schaalia sp. 19OD2882 TaxID=2794089 RepID=UPI001C1EA02B|nr:ABC transporter ATP-binding protein [Schaalia sp. 19OD2882]QWW20508.1 ABC transporter ATP-binding protein [Schaalia sp. 19OD2882]